MFYSGLMLVVYVDIVEIDNSVSSESVELIIYHLQIILMGLTDFHTNRFRCCNYNFIPKFYFGHTPTRVYDGPRCLRGIIFNTRTSNRLRPDEWWGEVINNRTRFSIAILMGKC